MTPCQTGTVSESWFTQPASVVSSHFGVEADTGLTASQVESARARYGANVLPEPAQRSAWSIILAQWVSPMQLMLTAVAAVSFLIEQTSTGLLITALVALNVALGARQEIQARSSVDALQAMQVPSARVRRDGALVEIPAADVVPGDIVLLEAGDLVPADGRILSAARLEAAESSLTGESAPVPKGAEPVGDPEAPLGDRSSMLFQNTLLTRGTATIVVTATGADTQMGQIAGMLRDVEVVASPLQQEVRGLTIRLSIVAWVAVAIIVVNGLARGLDTNAVILLGITTAISAIPSGLPTFLNGMLSFGAQRLAKAKAVVKSLNDVETLGSTSAINSDKTGTLTMDMMTATRMFTGGHWFAIEGSGYSTTGAILRVAGTADPDWTLIGYGLALSSDAVVHDDGTVVGDPTEAALVVLGAKMGIDARESRRAYPRIAEVPFDSAYKFMATVHTAPVSEDDEVESVVVLVKGAPDVLLERCSYAVVDGEAVPLAEQREAIAAANAEMGEQGLRVMAFAIRIEALTERDRIVADPMAAVDELAFVALVGIIDPLRPSAVEAIAIARGAGIDVRMITGDHATTARAIASELGLGPGVITGPELETLSEEQLLDRIGELHVFGRVSPQDKVRMVEVLQRRGDIVAMTGDAVNDAAAVKKADVGVAMGAGSDVTKQSARMILTDNNFATLVHAIELGRDIYGKISAQIRYVLTGLFGLLGVMLLASLLNINSGSVLSPVQLLFVSFLIGLFPAIALSTDSPEPGLMRLPPRDPTMAIMNRHTAPVWLLIGIVSALASLAPFLAEEQLGTDTAQTMTFAVLALATVWLAASMRRALAPIWQGPYLQFWLWMSGALVLSVLGVSWSYFQGMLGTVSLTGDQWWVVLGLSMAVPVVSEVAKAIARHRQ